MVVGERNPNPNANPSPKYLGLWAQAKKRKDSFIHLFLVGGVLMLSMRSLGQKYRVKDLQDDVSSLREEKDALASRMDSIKDRLIREAALDPTGAFSAKLGRLFNGDHS